MTKKPRVRNAGTTITLADVAREAGVSEITVSRVLRSKGPIAEKTREEVNAAARKVGYVLNRIAGSLATAGSDLVGVIIPSLTNIVFPDVLRGLDAALSRRGCRTVLSVTGSAADDDRAAAHQALIDALQQRGFRVVTATGSAAGDPTNNSVALCTTTGARTLVWGTLDTTRVATGGATAQTTAHIALQTYDCQAHSLNAQPTVVNHIAPVPADAIRGAVRDAVSAFPAPS